MDEDEQRTTLIASLQDQLRHAEEQVQLEKAGKRKLFHSLVKVANELRQTRSSFNSTTTTIGGGGGGGTLRTVREEQTAWNSPSERRRWWRTAPQVLPGVRVISSPLSHATTGGDGDSRSRPSWMGSAGSTPQPTTTNITTPLSLSDLFFNLVIVTGFTRVGVAMQDGHVDASSLLYFAILYSVWRKESSYSTRFATDDMWGRLSTLWTCFAVLVASVSVAAPLASEDGTRLMGLAALVAALHCVLHVRVALTNQYALSTITHSSKECGSNATAMTSADDIHTAAAATTQFVETDPAETLNVKLAQHVVRYAVMNVILTAAESTVWLVGMFVVSVESPYRWWCCIGGLLLGQRIPRAFLADDFHGTNKPTRLFACTLVPHETFWKEYNLMVLFGPMWTQRTLFAGACCKRGVLFILLLGFLMQSIVVVASEFFEYQGPSLEHYSFIGAACLMFFCIKLLYVDDGADLTRTEDHALLVNRYAAFWFNVGHFSLLLSTTVMGSGLNLLTHDFLASSAALPGAAKALVTGGFAMVLLSIFFIKSMHLKRVPTDRRNQALFIGAYLIQCLVLLAIVSISALMSLGWTAESGFLEYLMQTDSQLLFSLSGAALFLVMLSWLDEGVELALYNSALDSRQYRIQPFGLWWWCLRSDVSTADIDRLEESAMASSRLSSNTLRLSILSPLLGSSLADLKDMQGSTYQAIPASDV